MNLLCNQYDFPIAIILEKIASKCLLYPRKAEYVFLIRNTAEKE